MDRIKVRNKTENNSWRMKHCIFNNGQNKQAGGQ